MNRPGTREPGPLRPRAQDVATAAGVSQSAVSLVFSGKASGRISPRTQAVIWDAAARLGYRPNVSARSLRTGTAGLLGFVVPDATHPYFAQVVAAALGSARAAGRTLAVVETRVDRDWVGRLLLGLRTGRLDGAAVYLASDEARAALTEVGDRVVFVESGPAGAGTVEPDVTAAMDDVVAHLVALGHRELSYLTAEYPSATFARRHYAFLRATAAHGASTDPARWRTTGFGLDQATGAAHALLTAGRRGPRPVTAVVCEDDLLAAATYRACRQLALDVPRQVSVVGFGDLDLARCVHPELTTVALPAVTLGRASTDALVARLAGSTEPHGGAPAALHLPLVVRGSTGPAAPGPP